MYKEFFTKNSMDDQIIMKISNPCIQRNKPVERLNKKEKKKKNDKRISLTTPFWVGKNALYPSLIQPAMPW